MAISRAQEHACEYHRERALAEQKAATKASNSRAREAHLELARQHELAQAMMWYRERGADD